MKSRLFKFACIAAFGSLTLYGLEMLAQGQTTTTGGGGGGMSYGGGSGGSSISGGGGGGSISGGGGGGSISGGGGNGGNTQSFSGGDGSGFSGTTTTTRSSRSSTSTVGAQIPTSANRLGSYYIYPLSKGITSGTGTASAGSFNTPLLFAPATTTGTRGNTATRGKSKASTTTTATGFTTYGMDRTIQYATELDPDLLLPPRESPVLLAELRDIVKRSSVLKSKDNINVAIDQGVVVLRGEVATLAERGLVERMLRLEPGVRNVSNELTVAGASKQ